MLILERLSGIISTTMEEGIFLKKHKPFSPTIKIALGYIIFILVGTLLLLMPFSTNSGQSVGFMPALFTSTSAVCVTGLYVVDTFTTFNFFGQLVVLLLVQFGGLGFMTMASLLLMMLGRRISLKDKLSIAESLNNEDMSSSLKTIKMIVVITFCVEFLGAACVLPSFLNYDPSNVGLAVWRAIFHSIASFCNAGFDLMGGSGMTPFVGDALFNIVTVVVILCGGLGPAVITNVAKRVSGKEKITFNSKMIVYSSLIALFAGALYIFVAEYNNPATLGGLSLGEKVLAAFFQSMTTRSAGFNTIDQGALTAGGYLASNVLMVIGVAPASTGGGIKLATLVVLLASVKTTVSGGDEYRLGKRSINKKTFNKAVGILMVYILAIFCALAVISLTDSGFTLEQLVFECISALSNVGLTTGITWELSAAAQIVLIFLMYFGRAGFLCVVYSIVGPSKVNIRYPDSKIVIG